MFLKKVIVLVLSIEEPMWEETTKQKTNKEAKKIYETKKSIVTIFQSLRGFNLPYFPRLSLLD